VEVFMDKQAIALKYLERLDMEEDIVNLAGPYMFCTRDEMLELDHLFAVSNVFNAVNHPALGDTYYDRLMHALLMMYADMWGDADLWNPHNPWRT
jgi:hypothetical protein